ncbi:MAG: NHL repeat-containing protein [Pseudomonadota bacterium]
MLRFVGIPFGVLTLMILISVIVTPSAIEIVEKVKMLDQELLVRMYLILPLIVLWLFLALRFLHTEPARLRERILLVDLLIAIVVILFVMVADHNSFTSEAGRITYFTSIALILAGVCGVLNYFYHALVLGSSLMLRMFWAVLAAAFLFAALDEVLSFHEKIGNLLDRLTSPVGDLENMGDLVTLVYGFGGLVAGIVLLQFCRREFIKKGHFFFIIFIVAACLYATSTLLDSFDFFLVPLSTELDLVFMANCIEEIFEFLAANLFFVAFLIALLESNQFSLLKQATALVAENAKDRPMLRYTAYSVTAIFLLASGVVAATVRPNHDVIAEADRFTVEIFADNKNGLARPDGIFFSNGRLYVATASDVSVFGPDQKRTVLGDGTTGLKTPESIVVDNDGTVFVTDDTRNELLALRNGRAEVLLGASDGLRAIKGLAFDPAGNIFISDTEAAAVFQYRDGKLSLYASTLQGLTVPEEMAFDKDRNLYITEEKQIQVIKVTPDGNSSIFVDESSGLGSPESIAIYGDHVYVTDSKKGAIFRFDLAGRGGPMVHFSNRYRNLEGIAFDDKGSIFVASRKDDPVPSVIFKITEHSPHSSVSLR